MDLNYLYHRQQTSLMMARAAASPVARRAHDELASRYGALIDADRDATPWARPARLRLVAAHAPDLQPQ